MALFGLFKKKKEQEGNISAYPHLMALKPKERYVFRSDYFIIDDSYAMILSFFHEEGATDAFPTFWGINRIPGNLPESVSVTFFEQTRAMTEGWLRDHQGRAEGVANITEKEHSKTGSFKSKGKARRRQEDFAEISSELQDGASYIRAHWRLLVKAPTLNVLDDVIDQIERQYIDRFATLKAAPYPGEQRNELANLFKKNAVKEGPGFYLTSTEYAGSYSLVTHGLEDNDGEYIGRMVGDVNNSAVLFNVNRYDSNVVVVDENVLHGQYVTDAWGSKLAQSAMLENKRVVHIVMNEANLDKLGPKFSKLTSRINMEQGDVNMFEMFGKREDELAIFPMQMQKLILMAEQAYETTDADRSIIRGELERVATDFYVESNMWAHNARENRDKLRIVGIPHNQVPLLQKFVAYLKTAHKAALTKEPSDESEVHALKVLSLVFENLLSSNGALFNVPTSDSIDSAVTARRVIYDFGALIRRGRGVAMAQLVNIIGFAVGSLGKGDLVIIHGVDRIEDGVKEYIKQQLGYLMLKGGRVAYLYNNVEKMLEDEAFCDYTKADYTVFGRMTQRMVDKYQDQMGQNIPADLVYLITSASPDISYIRRGHSNVVFARELALGLDSWR